MNDPTLTWTKAGPGIWRSLCGRYVILRAVLPEDRPAPSVTYTLRKVDKAMAVVYPGTLGYLGYLLTEEHDLAGARRAAERDAYSDTYGSQRSVPDDHPAVALRRFYWPISDGVTRGALTVVRDGDRLVAQVVGMVRRQDDQGYEPAPWVEIDLTALGLTGDAETTSEHGPDPCPDCVAEPGAEHDDGCDVAVCLATGGQRLQCHDGARPAIAEDREVAWRGRVRGVRLVVSGPLRRGSRVCAMRTGRAGGDPRPEPDRDRL
jgi:hypothetical protein